MLLPCLDVPDVIGLFLVTVVKSTYFLVSILQCYPLHLTMMHKIGFPILLTPWLGCYVNIVNNNTI